MNLFTISQQYRALGEALAQAEGEMTDPLKEWEFCLEQDAVNAVENALKIALEKEARAGLYKSQAKEWNAAGAACEGEAARLRGYVERFLTERGLDKFETPHFPKLGFRKSPPSVILADDIDLDLVPEHYIRVKEEIDKSTLLKEWRKSMGTMEMPVGVSIRTDGRRLSGFKIGGSDE